MEEAIYRSTRRRLFREDQRKLIVRIWFLIPRFRKNRALRYLEKTERKLRFKRQFAEIVEELKGEPNCVNCAFYRPDPAREFFPFVTGECMNSGNWRMTRVSASGEPYTTVDDPIIPMPQTTRASQSCSLFQMRPTQDQVADGLCAALSAAPKVRMLGDDEVKDIIVTLLELAEFTEMSDTELERETGLGNEAAPIILRARKILRRYENV